MDRIFAKGYTYGWCAVAGDYQTKEAQDSLMRLKEDGVDYICLAFYVLQDTFSSTNIYYEYGVTPTDEDIIFAINKAHELGMKVCLKPVVNCKDGTWRAYISFPNGGYQWKEWFESYTRFMVHYAKLAQRHGCEMLCTGCEKNGMNLQAEYCRDMIAEVRKVYQGVVMHNVNHSREMEADWLDCVDIVGISAYYSLTDEGEDYSRQKMLQKWNEVKKIAEDTYHKYGKPVMFAEIGMRSEKNCSAYPWDFDSTRNMPVDQQEQADYYDTVMETFWDEPWFSGFFWWDWPAILYDIDKAKDDKNFCAYGKEAEQVLKKWYTK